MKPYLSKPIITTPIRSRQHSNVPNRLPLTPTRLGKQNIVQPQQHEYFTSKNSLSPSKGNNRKLVIPPKQPTQPLLIGLPKNQPDYSGKLLTKPIAPQTNGRKRFVCGNQPDKEAEFRIEYDGELMYYCGKCAASLASQGFTVEKLQYMETSRHPKLANVLQNFADPTILQEPRYLQISEFMNRISQVNSQFMKKNQAYVSLPQHYKQLNESVEEFYDAILAYINHIKSVHLDLIGNECKKYIQIGEMEAGDNQEQAAELKEIVDDLQTNINEIVLQVSQDKYRECLTYYTHQVQMFQGRIQQQTETLSKVTKLAKQDFAELLKDFKQAVVDLLGITEAGEGNNTFSNMPPSSMGKAPTGKPKLQVQSHRPPISGPFRNLFEGEGGDAGPPDQSPQFKLL